MATPPPQQVIQLRISLAEVTPEVWRRVLVPGGVRLAKLHAILQAAMGWTDSHLHVFRIGDDVYGAQFDDYPPEEVDERTVSVLKAVRGHERFVYEYDFGDGWIHHVLVEAIHPTLHGLRFGVCLAGESACPPEDCGGPGGYAGLIEAYADPDHEDHLEVLLWLEHELDPTAFDIAAINVELQRVR